MLLCHLTFFYWCLFFFNDTATTEIYTLSLHDALPISPGGDAGGGRAAAQLRGLLALLQVGGGSGRPEAGRSEEHTSELQSHHDLVCRLLLEKKNKKIKANNIELHDRNPYTTDACAPPN